MNLIDALGLFAGACITISVIPQIIKIWKIKKVKQISLLNYSILTFGIALWIVYGVLKKDWPIIVSNGISFLLNLTMVYFIIYYEKE